MPHSGGGGLVLWQNDWFSETCDFSSGDSTLNQTMQTTPVKDNTHRKNKCSAPDPLGGPVPYFGTHCASSSDTINASIGFMSVQYSASTKESKQLTSCFFNNPRLQYICPFDLLTLPQFPWVFGFLSPLVPQPGNCSVQTEVKMLQLREFTQEK